MPTLRAAAQACAIVWHRPPGATSKQRASDEALTFVTTSQIGLNEKALRTTPSADLKGFVVPTLLQMLIFQAFTSTMCGLYWI